MSISNYSSLRGRPMSLPDEYCKKIAPYCFEDADVFNKLNGIRKSGIYSAQCAEAITHTAGVIWKTKFNGYPEASGPCYTNQVVQAAKRYSNHEVYTGRSPQLIGSKEIAHENVPYGKDYDCDFYWEQEQVYDQEEELSVSNFEDLVEGKFCERANQGNTG